MHFLDKCEATVLVPISNPTSVELVLSYDFLEEANGSDAPRLAGLGFGYSEAAQIFPSGNVPFE
jgi:hypothetical protein